MAGILTQEQLNKIAAQNAQMMASSPQAQAIYQQQYAPTTGAYKPYVAPAFSTLPTTQTISNQSLGIIQPASTSYVPPPPQQPTAPSPAQVRTIPGPTGPVTSTPAPGAQNEELFNVLKTYLDELQRRGMAVNPNVEITPEKLAEFTAKAQSEIAPYYANQLKVARDEFLRSAGYASEDIQLMERRLEQQYGKALRNVGESAADRGFAQSGIRQEEERELASDTQNQIDDRRRQLSFDATGQAGQFARQFGTSNLPTVSPLGGAPRVLSGQSSWQQGAAQSPFYSLSDSVYQGLKGTQEFEQDVATRNRTSELEGAYRTDEAIKNYRTLTL